MRVKVYDGENRGKVIGRGAVIGKVTVYGFLMPDGSLTSPPNAEVRPDDATISDMKSKGATLREIKENAKIVLDDGTTVYGCQVWWGPEQDPPAATP